MRRILGRKKRSRLMGGGKPAKGKKIRSGGNSEGGGLVVKPYLPRLGETLLGKENMESHREAVYMFFYQKERSGVGMSPNVPKIEQIVED